jgi:MarR family transcriptional regulator, organic hydroperoxide resistance regulator
VSEFVALFTRASKLMRGAADVAMTRHGVRVGQNLVLEALWERDGQTPGEIAQRLHVTTPTIVKMATRMDAAGLLTRRRDAGDARLVRLHLTDRGRSLRNAVEAELRALEQRATATLTATERRHLERALAKIVASLDDIPPAAHDDEDAAALR